MIVEFKLVGDLITENWEVIKNNLTKSTGVFEDDFINFKIWITPRKINRFNLTVIEDSLNFDGLINDFKHTNVIRIS